MATSEAWPIPTLSKIEFWYFLKHTLDVEDKTLVPLNVLEEELLALNEEKDRDIFFESLHNRFLQALALPGDRITLADATKYTYEQLTEWIICADLLKMIKRIVKQKETYDLRKLHGTASLESRDIRRDATEAQQPRLVKAAKKFAADGVLGFHDLAMKVKGGKYQDANSLKHWQEATLDTEDLQPEFVLIVNGVLEQAENHRAEIVTETQAVLVVKGAGYQAQDQTLNQFLKGFWPAVTDQFPKATMIDRRPIPSLREMTEKPDQDTLGRIAEIRAGERRIWVKEAFWEPGITPPSPLSALLAEWRMATHVLGKLISELFRPSYKSGVKNRTEYVWDFMRYWTSLSCAHLLVLLVVAVVFWQMELEWLPFGNDGGVGVALLMTALVSVAISLPSALETYYVMKEGLPNRLPGVSSWLLVILLGSFVIHPFRYLLFVGLSLVGLVVWVLLRYWMWPYRERSESDTDLREWDVDNRTGEPQAVWQEKGSFLKRVVVSPWFYRYLLILIIPIGVLLVVLSQLLLIIPVTQPLGAWLVNLGKIWSSGGLGDVVVYANEPGEATWIRGAIVDDFVAFYNRVDVRDIHVFAHSQGTPITYETFFNHLPMVWRQKFKTYVTIGSVLNYCYQANGVMDLTFIPRFPLVPYPYQTFAKGFQWLNFWNHNDPIPAFSALDPYDDYLPLDPYNVPREYVPFQNEEIRQPTFRNPAAPLNIRTRGAFLPWVSHGEYWGNLEEVHKPFVRRIFRGERIQGENEFKPKSLPFNVPATLFILVVWVAVTGVAFGSGLMLLLDDRFPPSLPMWVCLHGAAWLNALPFVANVSLACNVPLFPNLSLPFFLGVLGPWLAKFTLTDWITFAIVVFAVGSWLRQWVVVAARVQGGSTYFPQLRRQQVIPPLQKADVPTEATRLARSNRY